MLIIQRPTVEAVDEEQDNRQRFAIGPLDPGFGHTLGNSLRRTLLSSIPGAGGDPGALRRGAARVHHAARVKEDVTDIILNLKDLLVRVHADEPVTLRFDKRGPGDATAADLQTTADVEVLNPELHIASLNAKGRLAFDVTVERGRGYVSADQNKRSSTIGVIPVDSIFSPVRRVTFDVEPVRVEQSTDFDRLVLDIETDGTITPREALASAGDTLRTLVGLVADLEESPQGLELGETGRPPRRLARPRPAHRGARPLRAPPQLPQAGADQHHRRAGASAPWTTCWHHQLRAEVARRGRPAPRRARALAAHQGLIGLDAGNTEAWAAHGRRRRPSEGHAGQPGGVAHRRRVAGHHRGQGQGAAPGGREVRDRRPEGRRPPAPPVVALIRDKDMAHKLFAEIGPRYADRPGGYTRILKLGPTPGGQRADGADRVRLGLPRRAVPVPADAALQRWRLLVAYDGAAFRGFALQPRCRPWPARWPGPRAHRPHAPTRPC